MFLAAYIRPGGSNWQSAYLFSSAIALVGGFAFVVALLSLNSLVSFLISWLVRDRRRSEIFVLVFVVVISAASVLPLLLGDFQTGAPARRTTVAVEARSFFELPEWTRWTPSGLYGTAVANSVNRSNRPWQQPYRDQYLVPLAELVAEGAIIYWLSFLVHRRLLESVEGGRSRRKGRLPGDGVMLRIPGFWPGTSAVALAQAYTALRTVRGRLVVLLPGPMVAMFAMLFRKLPGAGNIEQMIGTHGYVTFGAGMIFGLYAAQALTMNQYGSDRSGLTMQFLQPIRDVDLVRGKTAGCAIVFGAGAMITLACALVVAPGGSPWLWLATLFGGAATFLVISPIAAWISALFPVASDLSKTGTGGNPHAFAMIAGMFITAAALIPAALIIAFVPENYAPLWMAVWTTIAAALALPLLSLVARMIRSRRENLVLVSQGR
jgi:hypothetical protein